MYRLTNDPDVLECVETNQRIPRGHGLWPTEWLETNQPLPVALPYALNSPQHYEAIRVAAWEWMTSVVKARRYDSIESCCSYANSGVVRYREEALAMIAWRDDINQTLEALVVNPPPELATWEQVKALLPQPEAYAWPAPAELPLDTGPVIQIPE